MARGRKTGGRRKGVPNRSTVERQAQLENSGLLPLDFLLAVMRNTKQLWEERIDAAKAAAPYVHPKLANIELTGKDKGPLEVSIVRYSTAEPVGSPVLPAPVVDRARERL